MNTQFKWKNSKHSTPLFSSILLMEKTLSGASTPGQSGPESDGNKGVLGIPQSSSITRTSASDFFVSQPGHSLVGGREGLSLLQRSSRCILQPRL